LVGECGISPWERIVRQMRSRNAKQCSNDLVIFANKSTRLTAGRQRRSNGSLEDCRTWSEMELNHLRPELSIRLSSEISTELIVWTTTITIVTCMSGLLRARGSDPAVVLAPQPATGSPSLSPCELIQNARVDSDKFTFMASLIGGAGLCL
jgi:hypothetical protein